MAQTTWTAAQKQKWVDDKLKSLKSPIARERFRKRMQDEGVLDDIAQSRKDEEYQDYLSKPGVPEYQSYEDILSGLQSTGSKAESDAYRNYMNVRSSIRRVQKDSKGSYYIDPNQEMEVSANDPANPMAMKWVPARVELSDEEAIQMKAENDMKKEQMNRHKASYEKAKKARVSGEKGGYAQQATKSFQDIIKRRVGPYGTKDEPFQIGEGESIGSVTTDSPAAPGAKLGPAAAAVQPPADQMRKNVANTIVMARQGDKAPAWDAIEKDRLARVDAEKARMAALAAKRTNQGPPDTNITSTEIKQQTDQTKDSSVKKTTSPKNVRSDSTSTKQTNVPQGETTVTKAGPTGVPKSFKEAWAKIKAQNEKNKQTRVANRKAAAERNKARNANRKKSENVGDKIKKSKTYNSWKERQAAQQAEKKRKAEARKNK